MRTNLIICNLLSILLSIYKLIEWFTHPLTFYSESIPLNSRHVGLILTKALHLQFLTTLKM